MTERIEEWEIVLRMLLYLRMRNDLYEISRISIQGLPNEHKALFIHDFLTTDM